MQKPKIERLSFADGIISDASAVATPEGVVLRSCNFDLQPNGAAHLRPPLRREGSNKLYSGANTGKQYAFVWDAPDGANGQFVLAQVGTTFKFLARGSAINSSVTDATPTTASHAHGILGDATISGVLDGATVRATVMGRFCVITGIEMETDAHYFQEAVLIAEYVKEAGTVRWWYDLVLTRDFFGIEDARVNGCRVPLNDIDDAGMYNLFNQGWGSEVTGTAPSKYVIRNWYTNSGFGGSAAELCALQSTSSTSYVALTLNGSQVLSTSTWAPLDVPTAITATLTGGPDTVYLEITGTSSDGATGTEVLIMAVVAGVGGGSSTKKYTEITQLRWKTTLGNIVNIVVGVPAMLPGDQDNWTLGVYDASSTSRGFSVTLMKEAPPGTGVSPKGHYIVPLHWRSLPMGMKTGRGEFLSRFIRIWDGYVGYPALENDRSGRPYAVCTFAGRVWYSGTRANCDPAIESTNGRSPNVKSIVAFSRVVNSKNDLCECYQRNDPTDPTFNNILPDDGGYVRIQGAGEILGLVAIANGVVAVASNGVWFITGSADDGFRADVYQVIKLSEVACVAPDSIVAAGNYCTFAGLYGLYIVGPSQNGMTVTPVTDGKNSALYKTLSAPETCKAAYDSAYNKVHFLFSDSGYTDEFVLDLTTGSLSTRKFVPGSWTILGYCQFPSGRVASLATDIRCPNYGYILGNNTDVYLGYIRYDDEHGATYSWADEGGSYASVSELFIGHVSVGDLGLKKYTSYLDTFFERTEYQYVIASGNVTLSHGSSCLVDAWWEWANTSASQYKAAQFQAYKYRRPFIPTQTADGTYTFNYGQSVIHSECRLRGAGKTLALRFVPEASKDCKLLGFQYRVGAM